MIKQIRQIQYPSDIRKVEYPSYTMTPLGNVSWGAIWGGVFVTLAALLCLGLFGASFGTAKASVGAPTLISIGPVGAFWLWFSGIVSYLLGGWITGHLTHSASATDNAAHALVTWAVATIVLALALAGGTAGAAGMIGQNGAFLVSPAHSGLVAFYSFVVLVCEGIASLLGAVLGTRLYRPIAVEERHSQEATVAPYGRS